MSNHSNLYLQENIHGKGKKVHIIQECKQYIFSKNAHILNLYLLIKYIRVPWFGSFNGPATGKTLLGLNYSNELHVKTLSVFYSKIAMFRKLVIGNR
jgi:hypothetical protein